MTLVEAWLEVLSSPKAVDTYPFRKEEGSKKKRVKRRNWGSERSRQGEFTTIGT
jgi:hypothetical protein